MNYKKNMLDQKQKSKTYNYEKIIKLAEEIRRMTEAETQEYGRNDLHKRRGTETENRS